MATKTINKISDLLPDERNANKGTPRGRAMVEDSVRSYGAGRSILIDKHGKIIAGNKTVESCVEAGLEHVQVVESDGSKLIAVQRIDLDLDNDPKARELAVIDNRASEVGLDWDADVIAAFEQEGLDLSAMFTDQELSDLVGAAESEQPSAPAEFESYDENLETAYCCPKCGYEWSGQPK